MFLQPCRAAMASRVSFVRLGASLVQRGPPRAHKALLAEELLWTGPLATTRTRAAPIAIVSRLGSSRSYDAASFAGLGSVIVPEFVLAAIWQARRVRVQRGSPTGAIRPGDVSRSNTCRQGRVTAGSARHLTPGSENKNRGPKTPSTQAFVD